MVDITKYDQVFIKQQPQSFMERNMKAVYFIGIGGVGMGAIAEVLLAMGIDVSGANNVENAMTQRLAKLGAKIFIGHAASQISDVDAVVISTAISSDNPELIEANKKNIPILKRAQMLGEIMRTRCGIAVAGTHGKTTTSSLLASIFVKAKTSPTFVVGGYLHGLKTNAGLGTSEYCIVEADESDGSFMYLSPMVSVITNIDNDHLATYNFDFDRLKQTFLAFINRLPFYGEAVVCSDCEHVRALMPQIDRPVVTYGLESGAMVRALNYTQKGTQAHFTVQSPYCDNFDVTLALPGAHNVQNALAAITVALKEGIAINDIQAALHQFEGVGRRFDIHELQLPKANILMVDDYAHHPNEIKAFMNAVRKIWPNKRVVMAFQPHRYSRTQDCYDEFCQALSMPDTLLLLNIFSAGEAPIEGVSSAALVERLCEKNNDVHLITEDAHLENSLHKTLNNDDILVMLGAGSIGRYAKALSDNYAHDLQKKDAS